MSNSSSEKYKQFRNYMTNELGITRADIEAWTKESVAVEVNKKLGQINIDDLVKTAISKYSREALGISNYSGSSSLRTEIAEKLSKQLVITFATEK
jgi:hypothetical protein